MKAQIFISSYPKDYPFLIHCLASIGKFAKDFLPTIVCVDTHDVSSAKNIISQSNQNCRTAIFPQSPGMSGFMRAQLGMLHADLMCPEADVILFLGSDCCAHAEFTPQMYCAPDGKPAVLYSSYQTMNLVHPDTLPWRPGVERILKFRPDNEYMRRLPSVFPSCIFGPMRAHVEKLHKKPFSEYIYTADVRHRNTSEANLLGAYAHRHLPETCHWVDIADAGMHGTEINGWPSPIGQFWSHGGLDRPMEACFNYSVRGETRNSVKKTPRQVYNEIVYGIFK